MSEFRKTMRTLWEYLESATDSEAAAIMLSESLRRKDHERWTPEFTEKVDQWWHARVAEKPEAWIGIPVWWSLARRAVKTQGVDWQAWATRLAKRTDAADEIGYARHALLLNCPEQSIVWSDQELHVLLAHPGREVRLHQAGVPTRLKAIAGSWQLVVDKMKGGAAAMSAELDYAVPHFSTINGGGLYWLLSRLGCTAAALGPAIQASPWDAALVALDAGDAPRAVAELAKPGWVAIPPFRLNAMLTTAGISASPPTPEAFLRRLLDMEISNTDWMAVSETIFRIPSATRGLGSALQKLAVTPAWDAVAPVWHASLQKLEESGELKLRESLALHGTDPRLWRRFLLGAAIPTSGRDWARKILWVARDFYRGSPGATNLVDTILRGDSKVRITRTMPENAKAVLWSHPPDVGRRIRSVGQALGASTYDDWVAVERAVLGKSVEAVAWSPKELSELPVDLCG